MNGEQEHEIVCKMMRSIIECAEEEGYPTPLIRLTLAWALNRTDIELLKLMHVTQQ